MKYLIFIFFCLSVIPVTLLMALNPRWLKYAALSMILPTMLFDAVSINFFSHELYRGTSRGMEISLIYLAALSILLVYALRKRRPLIFPETGAVLYFCYLLLSLPSFFNSANRLFSFFEFWKMIMMMIVFLGVFYYLDLRKDLRTLLYGFGIITVFNFLSVVIQHVRGISQAHGLFNHQNSMGMYMVLLGSVFFSYYLNRKRSYLQLLAGLFFLCAGAACARTYSRGSILSFPLGCVIVFLCSLYYQFRLRKVQMLAPLAGICLVGALLIMPKIISRFENAPKESLNTRKNLAVSAVNMMRDKTFRGVGLNNWGIMINPPYPYCTYRYNNSYYDRKTEFKEAIVETIYLLVGAECGIFCMTALLAWLGYYLFLTFSLMKKFKRSELFFLPAGLVGGLTAVYLQSTMEWVLKQQVNFCQLIVFFAVLSYLNAHRNDLAKEKILLEI